jgi:hypothetical protein
MAAGDPSGDGQAGGQEAGDRDGGGDPSGDGQAAATEEQKGRRTGSRGKR